MGVLNDNTRLGASAAGAYEIERSLRFNSADSAYLDHTPGSSGNRQVWTWSAWVKRTLLSTTQYIFVSGAAAAGGNLTGLVLNSSNCPIIYWGSSSGNSQTGTIPLRDTGAWFHLVLKADGSNCTMYVNNVQYHQHTNTGSDGGINHTQQHSIGNRADSPYNIPANMYIAENHFVDGTALNPSSFAEEDPTTGAWIPKEFAGTYGSNGWYLNFSDNSNTTAGTLGADTSGNGNNWTPNNFSVAAGVGCDSMEDTPTNNYATLNSLFTNGTENAGTLSNGNLRFVADNNYAACQGTQSLKTGQWYWEITNTSAPSGPAPLTHGITRGTGAAENTYPSYDSNGVLYGLSWSWNGTLTGSSGDGATDGGAEGNTLSAHGNGDVLGFASDIPSGTLKFYKNGTLEHTTTGLNSHDWFPTVGGYNGQSCEINFGQRAFAHTPPTGYKSLCTANMAEPTIKKSTDHFNTLLYTGNGGTQSITGVGFQADMVWIKDRGAANWHDITDIVRGVTKSLFPNVTNVETTAANSLTSFDSDGFGVGNNGQVNANGNNYAAWNWKESATAGFDIVSYTGTGSSRTVSHNLGVVPEIMIIKNREATEPWWVYSSTIGAGGQVRLNENDAQGSDGGVLWNSTAPTSSVFTVNTNTGTNGSDDNIIAYLFSSVEGYSKFGSYLGNGSANGTFVYTGFKPAWLLIKRTNDTGGWELVDNKRNTSNEIDKYLYVNSADSEYSGEALRWDFLSNGFKMRTTNVWGNASGSTYIYLAFAETPFKYATAR